MAGWPRSFSYAIGQWRLKRRIRRDSIRIAREINPTLWENVRRKVASSSEKELMAYAKARAAQLCHERIDVMMQADATLSGDFATQLLVKSTDRAIQLVRQALVSARRSAA